MMRFTSLVAKSLFTLLITGGTFVSNLHAQSNAITVRVPFPFTVGTQSIASGTYQFSLQSDHFLLFVLNVKTGDVEMFEVRPEQRHALEQRGRLIFGNSSGRSILNEIHFPGASTFSEVIQRHDAGRIEAKRRSMDGSISVAQR